MPEQFDPYYKWLGIPPKDQPPHHYRLLGIEAFESDPQVIESAADRQMTHVRSFQAGPHSELSQRVLNELSAAKICLLNPKRRADYDSALRVRLAPPPQQPSPPTVVAAQVVSASLATPLPPTRADAIPVASAAPVPRAVQSLAPRSQAVSFEATPASEERRSSAPVLIIAGVAAALLLMVGAIAAVILSKMDRQVVQPPGSTGVSQAQTRPSERDTSSSRPKRMTAMPPAGAPRPGVPPGFGNPAGAGGSGLGPGGVGAGAGMPPGQGQMPSPRRPPFPIGPQPGNMAPARPGENPLMGFAPPRMVVGATNLLHLVDPAKDAVKGQWRMDGNALAASGEGLACLQPRFTPPTDYQLVLTAECLSGLNVLGIGLLVDGVQTLVKFEDNSCQLHLAAGQADTAVNTHRGPTLLSGRPNTIVCDVHKENVKISCNGKTIVNWSGDAQTLANDPSWEVPNKDALFVGGWSSGYRFSHYFINPLSAAPAPTPPSGSTRLVVDQRIDLLKDFDLKRNTVAGNWQLNADGLVTPMSPRGPRFGLSDDTGPRVQIPYALPVDYGLEMKVERIDGDGCLVVGMVHDGIQFVMLIDADGNHKQVRSESFTSTIPVQWRFTPGKASTLQFSMEGRYLWVKFDDQPPYRKSLLSKSMWPGWAVRDASALVLGAAGASFRISSLTLLKFKGVIGDMPLPPAAPGATPPMLAKPLVPPLEEREKALTKALEKLELDPTTAKTPQAKIDLANSLRTSALAADLTDPVSVYAVFDQARTLAATGGDLRLAEQIAGDLARRFECDPLELEKLSYVDVSKAKGLSNTTLQSIVDEALLFIAKLVKAERFDLATDVHQTMKLVINGLRNVKLSAKFRARELELKEWSRLYKDAQDAARVLAANPDNAAANLKSGLYDCLVKQDGKAGIAKLAKGSDKTLREAALADVKNPFFDNDQVDVGDRWWAIAMAAPMPSRLLFMDRAVYWYKKADPFLTTGSLRPTSARLVERLAIYNQLVESVK